LGPLTGTRFIELAGIGPGPFCGMMLADMGAEVIRVERPGLPPVAPVDPLQRSRRSMVCDLKSPEGVEVVLRLVESADGLFEGYRPGVAERIGVGPETCHARNPRLVYGRMTGWGQDGPLARAAGHDINYIALAGALHPIGREGERPVPPLNLVGDFGGGGMFLAYGLVCALFRARATGEGDVVDCAMVEGASALMAPSHGFKARGLWSERTGTSYTSGATHFYDTYETRDGRFVSIASLEPAFYDALIDKAGLDRERFAPHMFDRAHYDDSTRATWKALKTELKRVFATKTRDEWCEIMEGTDVCFAPVLTLSEALEHPHLKAREAFVDVGGDPQPAPAPRFAASGTRRPDPPRVPGADTREVLEDAGFSKDEIAALLARGAVAEAPDGIDATVVPT